MAIEDIEREAMANPPAPSRAATNPTPAEQARIQQLNAASRRRFTFSLIFAGGAVMAGAAGLIFHNKLKPDIGFETNSGGFVMPAPDSDNKVIGKSSKFQALSNESVRHIALEPPEREAQFQKALDAERVKKNAVFDEATQNWITPDGYRNRIEEALVKGKINDYELIAKKSVMERFDAAWEVLKEAGISFQGTAETGHYRKNSTQYAILERYAKNIAAGRDDYWVGGVVGSYHMLGQAIDVRQMGDGRNRQAQKIKEVLRIFGFTYGIKAQRDKSFGGYTKKGWSMIKDIYAEGKSAWGKKSLANIKRNLAEAWKTEDRVHFQMKKDDLDKAMPIEQAKQKARALLKR